MAAAASGSSAATVILGRRQAGARKPIPGMLGHLRVGLPGHVMASGLSSPSDAVKSPVTKALEHRRHPKDLVAKHPRLQVILGSTSQGRRSVMATLGIPFSSMKPDIDEKAVRHPDPYGLPVVVAAAKCDALLKRVHIPAIVITADQIVVAPSGLAVIEGKKASVESIHDSVVATIRLAVGENIVKFPGLDTATHGHGFEDTAPEAADTAPEAAASDVYALPPPDGNGRVPESVGLVVREKPCDIDEAKEFIAAYSNSWVQCVSGLVVHNTATGARAAGVDVATVRYNAIPASAIQEITSAGADADVLHCCGAVMVEHPSISPYVASMGAPLQSVMGLPIELLRDLMIRVGWEEPEAAV